MEFMEPNLHLDPEMLGEDFSSSRTRRGHFLVFSPWGELFFFILKTRTIATNSHEWVPTRCMFTDGMTMYVSHATFFYFIFLILSIVRRNLAGVKNCLRLLSTSKTTHIRVRGVNKMWWLK